MAAPAPSLKIELTDGGTKTDQETSYFYLDGFNAYGKQVVLQVFSNSTWKTVSTPATLWSDEDYTEASYKFAAAGVYKFRAAILKGSAAATVSKELSVTYTPYVAPTYVWASSFDGEMGSPTQGITYIVDGGRGAVLTFQRSEAGRWINAWTSKLIATDNSTSIKASYTFATSQARNFRAVVVRGGKTVAISSSYELSYKKPATYLYISTDTNQPKKVLCVAANGINGAMIAVQRLNGTKWTTLWTTPKALASGKLADYSYTFTQEGKATFRAVATKAGATVAISPNTVVSYARDVTTVFTPSAKTLFGESEGKVAAGAQLSAAITLVGIQSTRTGAWQELRGNTWTTLQKLSWTPKPATGISTPQTVKTVSTTADTVKKYRFIVDATTREKAYVSATTAITHVNPARYTGYKLQAYNYMKKYCPAQIINVISPGASYAYYPSYKINMASQYKAGKSFQYVALHECAHIRTFKLYASNINGMYQRLDAIYGGNGVEQVADCMAYQMGADVRYGGTYTKNCTGYRGTAAKLILQGKKP